MAPTGDSVHATSVASEDPTSVAKMLVTGSLPRASQDESLPAYPATRLRHWVATDTVTVDNAFETWEPTQRARQSSSDRKGEPLFFPTERVEETFPTEVSDMVLGTQSSVGLIVYSLGS